LGNYEEKLWLVYGDQLTSHHIRAVQMEQIRATQAYDRKEWMIGLPSFFHIKLSLISLLTRTHWGPTESQSSTPHTLSNDISSWNQNFTVKDRLNYNKMDRLVGQSYRARIAALLFDTMRARRLLSPTEQVELATDDGIKATLRSMDPTVFYEIVEDIRVQAFTRNAWRGYADYSITTMHRML
jgi:hypothetical protein